MPIEVKNGVVVFDDATPVEIEQLRAAVRILIEYLLERASLNDDNETQTEAEDEPDAEPQTVQLRLES